MLSRNQFEVLKSVLLGGVQAQRTLAEALGMSLGSVNAALGSLRDEGLVGEDGRVTQSGRDALEPFKVDNAIIMAAGLSSRFAPISYEQPKGLLRVHGEVLIERQIRQLKQAGIDDITVVVGYMKEQFFYLEDEFGVKIVVNEEYANRNNNSTLMLVRERLGNTFVCSSDDYFTENVFEPYVYQAYYAAVFFEGPTDEYCLKLGAGKRIVGVQVGGRDAYGMLGHAYFDRAFSHAFARILEQEYDRPDTAVKLWEDIYAEHVGELDMVMRAYSADVIHEFDSLDELADFDPAFIENVDSSILDNICETLGVARDEIGGIEPISQGLTNLSFKFSCRGSSYVYRHPGAGTDAIISREAETFAQEAARELGLDGTFIYEDARAGWKISRYLEACTELDYHDEVQVARALEMARTLHRSGVVSRWSFDVYEKTLGIVELLDARQRASFKDFRVLFERVEGLAERVAADGVEPCLCHNDFYSPNILVQGDDMYLIDWEYAGMSDYASDLGTFICCSDYTYEESLHVFELYFQREPTTAELAHCLAYVALASYYWFVWALYKDACGAPVGEWLYLWYRNAKLFAGKAYEAYEAYEPHDMTSSDRKV